MVEIIIGEPLDRFSKKLNIDLQNLSENAFNFSINANFKPTSKFILNTLPETTVCYDIGYNGIPNILIDFLKLFIENKELRDSILIYDITHEISHGSIGKTSFSDMVNYNIFKGKFVKETSKQDFKDKIENLLDNVPVDTRLCLSNESLLKSYYASNHLGFYDNLNQIKYLYYKRKKLKTFPINLDSFNLIINILHTASVSRTIKNKCMASGIYRQILTKWDSLFHQGLKRAIGNTIINEELNLVYNELINIAENKKCSKKNIYVPLKSIWSQMEELKNN